MGQFNNREQRADAYYSGKEQLVAALRALANHIHAPPAPLRKIPEQITAQDISDIRQAHRAIRDTAEKLGLEINCLEI